MKDINMNTQKLRIGFLSEDTEYYSGGRYNAFQMAIALSCMGHEVYHYTQKTPPYISDWDWAWASNDNYKIINSPISEATKGEFDLVIGTPQEGNDIACDFSKYNQTKSVITMFDPLPLIEEFYQEDYNEEVRVNGQMYKKIKNSNVHVIVTTEIGKEKTHNWLQKDYSNIHVVNPCVNDVRQIKVEEKNDLGDYFVAIGRFVDRKNFKDLLISFSTFKDRDVKLVLITRKPSDELFRLISVLRITENVVIFDSVSDSGKYSLIKNSMGVLTSSLYEGFGMPIIEAMEMSKPIVCYEYPIFREVIGDYSLGRFAQRGSVYSFANEMNWVFDHGKEDANIKNPYTFINMQEQLRLMIQNIWQK